METRLIRNIRIMKVTSLSTTLSPYTLLGNVYSCQTSENPMGSNPHRERLSTSQTRSVGQSTGVSWKESCFRPRLGIYTSIKTVAFRQFMICIAGFSLIWMLSIMVFLRLSSSWRNLSHGRGKVAGPFPSNFTVAADCIASLFWKFPVPSKFVTKLLGNKKQRVLIVHVLVFQPFSIAQLRRSSLPSTFFSPANFKSKVASDRLPEPLQQ